MSRWAVVIPSPQETNILSNPSFETNTSGWTAVGATLTRVATQQRRGVYSLSIAPTSGVNDGAYATVTTTVTPHGFGIDVLGVAGVPYLIRWADTSGNLLGTATTFTGTGKWQRVWVGWNESSATTRRVYVSKNNHASTGTFYVDGAKVSAESAESTYFDGDTVGFYSGDYYWLGAAHASQSVRKAYIRHGGRIADFETEFGFLVEGHMGFGLSKIVNILLPLALVGGAVFQRQVPQERSAALVGSFTGTSEQDLQQKRQKAIAALGPNVYGGRDEPVMLLYRAGDGASTQPYLEIPALNEDGLKGGRSKGNTENAAIQFTVYLPYVAKQGNSAAVLDWQDTHTANYISQRSASGVWSALTSGTNGWARIFARGLDGAIYVGGQFTSAGGVANTTYIAKWDGIAWSALGTGVNGEVRDIRVGQDGAVYVAGLFTSAGGVANTLGIAKWNGTTWSSVGNGVTTGTNVVSLEFGADGALYASGNFSAIGGVSASNIAKWDGTAWSALGSGLNVGATDLVLGNDGCIYATGSFTTAGGSSANYIAKWDGTAWSALGSGLSAQGYTLTAAPDGSIYVGGNFTSAGGASNTAYAARWNGISWSSFGSGLNGTVYQSRLETDGVWYVEGAFTIAGGIPVNYIAGWNGSAWASAYDYKPQSGTALGFFEHLGYRVVGINSTGGTSKTNGVTTVTNVGSSPAHPVIKFTGPGTVYSISNLTTGADIDFNLTLVAGETATLDTSPVAVSFVSSMRGNILGTIIPGSEVTTFTLVPGANNITTFIAGTTDGNTAAVMTWPEAFAGIDGGSQ